MLTDRDAESGPVPPRDTDRIASLLCALVCALLALLAFQVARRVGLPWDYYIWSESPFMTNMLKLSSTFSLFDAPADANSWVYAPGLEYLCFALLNPLSLQLDVRACRVVVIACGLLASFFASKAGSLLLPVSIGGARPGRTYRIFSFAILSLVVFKNFTSDVCHPDNLYMAHACVTFYLALLAVTTGKYRIALAAVVLSGLGVLTKQTAAFGVVGISGALFFAGRSLWSLSQRCVLAIAGAATLAAATGVLLSSSASRFFLFEVLVAHPRFWARWAELLWMGGKFPHKLVLLSGAAFAVFRLVAAKDRAANVFLVCWLGIGAEVLPTVLSYVKALGAWNNLGIFDLWLAIPVVPVLWRAIERREAAVDARALCAGALALLAVCLVPLKSPPPLGQREFGFALTSHIREDLAAGRTFLLPHGTVPLVRAGVTAAPLDRSNTVLEMNMGGLAHLAGTRGRIEAHYYRRIYMIGTQDFYDDETLAAIARNYHEVEVIRGDMGGAWPDGFIAGHQALTTGPIRVMEAN